MEGGGGGRRVGRGGEVILLDHQQCHLFKALVHQILFQGSLQPTFYQMRKLNLVQSQNLDEVCTMINDVGF